VTGLQIVEHLAGHPRGARLGDIATATGMDTGQTHRIVAALAEGGWVSASDAEKGLYTLTGRVVRLGATYTSKLDLAEMAQPFMEELLEKTGETIHLGELRDKAVVCVGLKLSDRRLTVFTKVGDQWPLTGTSMGHAIRAAAFGRTGEDPIATVVADEVKLALREGFGRDFGRYRDEVQSVAAPIRNSQGVEVGALAIAGPSSRVGEAKLSRFGGLVRDAAIGISERMGCFVPWPPR
jgi:IclR family acetate operon transcriptional repressor